jgi:hypothetical protein
VSNTSTYFKGARTTAVCFATRVFRVTRLPAGFALAPVKRHREPAGPPDSPPRSALDALEIRARRAFVRVSTRPFATVLAFPVSASLVARGVAGERASLTIFKP